MTTKPNPLAVRIGAEQAGAIGEWRGVAYVNGLAEFITDRTYESQEEALRRAQSLRPQALHLARENAAALAAFEVTL